MQSLASDFPVRIEQNSVRVRNLSGPMHLGLNQRPFVPHILCQAIGALFLQQSLRWPPCLVPVCPPGPKRKEPRLACLSEAKASHSHKMWSEVSSSVPHFLHMGSLHSSMIPEGVMYNKQANNNPGLCPVKGQQSSPRSQIRARNQFSSLSLCTAGANCRTKRLCFRFIYSRESSLRLGRRPTR